MVDLHTRREQLTRFIKKDLWQKEPASGLYRIMFRTLRFGIMVGRGFVADKCFLRSTALAYTTIFATVPVLIVMFALLGAFAPFQRYEEQITEFIFQQVFPQRLEAELRDEEAEEDLGQQIRTFIAERQDQLREASPTIGTFGIGILIFSIISLLAAVERAFNAIWGIHRARGFFSRLIYYWAGISALPLLLIISLGATASITGSNAAKEALGIPLVRFIIENPMVAFLLATSTSVFLMWIAFTAIYMFLPNTKVAVKPAMIGGICAAVLFEALKWGQFMLSAQFIRYSALYGSLVAIPIFLVWVYFIWTIVLLGCEIAFGVQNFKTYAREQRVAFASELTREATAIRLFALICHRFHHGEKPLSTSQLSDWFDIPVRLVRELCHCMSEARILSEIQDDDIRYQPARSIESITVKNVIDCLRGGKDFDLRGHAHPEDDIVDSIFLRGESASDEIYAATTFADIIARTEENCPKG